MPLLSEYALTPDVFDSHSFPHEEVGSAHFQYLKEVLLNEALVRNLRNGAWLELFGDTNRPWHHRGKELLKKLAKQNRLRLSSPVLPNPPTTDAEWCHEALASHAADPLTGIISTRATIGRVTSNSILGQLDRLSNTTWWPARSPSVRLLRNIASYQSNLDLILKCANSYMFIDPHLDPALPRYRDWLSIIQTIARRHPVPLVEIHRVCYVSSGSSRTFRSPDEWRGRFQEGLRPIGIPLEVFIWDDFHDRYLITDLIGIELQNGFDTTTNPNAWTTWGRLGRGDRDDVQREFDTASNRHTLRNKFRLE